MQWLKSNYALVSLDELLQNKSTEKKIAITFDDGYANWYSNVFPVLKELNIPATFFVNSGLIGLEGEKMQHFFRDKCHRTEKNLNAISKKETY